MKMSSTAKILRKLYSCIVLVSLLMMLCTFLSPTPAPAQTFDECEMFIQNGQWDAADESCSSIIREILITEQNAGGSYCDNCEHSLDEMPSLAMIAKLHLAYSRASYDEALVTVHGKKWKLAKYWLAQATGPAQSLAMYVGPDAIVRSLVPMAKALYRKEKSELTLIMQHS